MLLRESQQTGAQLQCDHTVAIPRRAHADLAVDELVLLAVFGHREEILLRRDPTRGRRHLFLGCIVALHFWDRAAGGRQSWRGWKCASDVRQGGSEGWPRRERPGVSDSTFPARA